jgi:hypothetical protein
MSLILSIAGNHAGDAIEFIGRTSRSVFAEERGNEIFRRTIEERFDEMAKGGAAGDFAGHDRKVNVAKAVFFVAKMAFFFENPQLSAHGGVVRFVGELGEDLGNGGAFQFVENVHDLAFAAG